MQARRSIHFFQIFGTSSNDYLSLLLCVFRVSQLEKDLYYYKKTSRDLKRRLRDYVSSGTIPAQGKAISEKKIKLCFGNMTY